jgi:murein L,D-transpeptidase YafK
MTGIWRYLLPLLLAVAGGGFPAAHGSAVEMADRVVVHKAERKLLLMRGDEILRTFDVALGLSPTGRKQREGDFRTPEGNYLLNGRKADSDYFLAIQVSYPGPDDLRRASADGVAPGGLIMIHGQPNRPNKPLEYYKTRDWTNGCIAVSNSDMVEIWLMTPDNTPIQILP